MKVSEELDVEDIKRLIRAFNDDADVQKLKSLYSTKSFPEIMGVSRGEISHSSFIAWMLNTDESHGLGNFTLKKLLEILVYYGEKKISKQNKGLVNSIILSDFQLNDVLVTTEKSIPKAGRLDIYIEAKVFIPSDGKEQRLFIVLENKVNAKEGKGQTEKYYDYFEGVRKGDDIYLYVYLTPLSSLALSELKEPECSCKEFIQINYQSIADFIIKKALKRELTDRTRFILSEYSLSLSQPSIEEDTNKKEILMALGEEEKDLLNKFWNKNQNLIKAALYAISSDADQEEDARKSAEILNAKDFSKYVFNGEVYGKGRLVLAVIQHYVALNPMITYRELVRKFPQNLQGSKGTLAVKSEAKERRNFLKPEELITLGDDSVIAVSNQWGSGNIPRFLEHVRNELNYTITKK